MGYLNNASVTVDAILTTKGRELLSKGTTNGLDIKYFALGDDEVNYDLWNPSHPLGSDYYGIVIENMPVLEASPLPEQNLKSKLLTLDRNGFNSNNSIPTLTQVPASVNFTFFYNNNSTNSTTTISPQSAVTEDSQFGYSCNFDSKYLTVTGTSISSPASSGDQGSVLTVTGKAGFVVSLQPQLFTELSKLGLKGAGTLQTNVAFTGNGSGIRSTTVVTISYTMPS
jgi:hypothetical protein